MNQNPVILTANEFEFKWLSTSGTKIVDSGGNQVVLHGVNCSGLEYDTIGKLEPLRSLRAADPFIQNRSSWYQD